MRRSATSTWTERKVRDNRGFTLIELLVVLVLIAVITSLAVTRLSLGGDPGLEREARRLAAVLDMAMDTAIIQSRELGLVLDEDGYSFVRLEGGEWEPYGAEGDRIFGPHQLPDTIRLNWQSEDRESISGPTDSGDANGADAPGILLLSSGETSPAELELQWRDRRDARPWIITLGSLGRLRVQAPGDERP